LDKISVLGCKNYDIDVLDGIIESHFKALDPDGILIKKGDNVAIKPNLLLKRNPNEATTTHPEFIAAIIRAVKRRGGVPIIAESPGGPYNRYNLKSVYAGCGIEAIAQREGAQLNYDVGFTEVVSEDAKVCHSLNIIDPILRADVVISAAKLKTHAMMNYSGAVKNLFGVIPGLMKPEFHYRFPKKEDFANMLVDICERVKPAISFIDGIEGMEGNGPSGGTKRFVGVTLAGLNPHSLDLLASRLVGFTPQEVPTLGAAIERELCPKDISTLEIVGERAERFLVSFVKPESMGIDILAKLPAFLRKPLTNALTPKPVILKPTCIGCGKCAESCPQKTISIANKKAVINYSKCIRCYCCHEMCPEKSIAIKKSLMGRF
jgi:uncharacterized protein (DUF362 family)/Pyruvate/2-oxoacid:ferredoxin oxidoreductase delta subunit